MAEQGIRAKVADPIETAVIVATSSRTTCACGREAWLIDGETWHSKRRQPKDSRCELLEPCAPAVRP